MNINELFETIQDNLEQDEIKGEIILHNNSIVWSYDLNNEDVDVEDNFDEEEDFLFDFESTSSEERLMEVYHVDIEPIERIIDDFCDDDWNFTEPKVLKTSISFKIL